MSNTLPTTQPISPANFYSVNHSPYAVKTVGILGGGQLGMMLAEAAMPLGIRCLFLEAAANPPARLLGKVYSHGQFEDFAATCDVFTLEFENTSLKSAQFLEASKTLYPPAKALFIAQDRLNEKNLFNELGIKTVPFMAVQSKADIATAAQHLGLPLVLKTTRGGYDGKGQFVLKTVEQIDDAWAELGDATNAAPLIAEGFINFEREVSIIAVRGKNGEIRYYPLVQNEHHQGILAKTTVPAPNCAALTTQAQDNIKKLLEYLDYVGVLTLELFVTPEGLLANEIAPRVHNSGHWSIEGAVCSQFENHMRAVAGLPLGDTSVIRPSVMLNVIGQYPDLAQVLAIDGVHVHNYDKEEREGRKIAHITVMPTDSGQLEATVAKVVALLPNRMGL